MMRVRFFGEPWPTADERAPICEDDAYRVDAPVGRRCIRCEKRLQASDRGLLTAASPEIPLAWTMLVGGLQQSVCAYHLECFLLETLGPDIARSVRDRMEGEK